MSKRVDSASRLVHASPSKVYRAFADAGAMESWLPPLGMVGRMLAFEFREGGSYRLRLTYTGEHHAPGKTSPDADEAEVRFVRLVPDRCIEQAVDFASDAPAFSGEMRIVWTLEPVGGETLVTVRCEDVPVGISAEDHQVGLASTLGNLAAFV